MGDHYSFIDQKKIIESIHHYERHYLPNNKLKQNDENILRKIAIIKDRYRQHDKNQILYSSLHKDNGSFLIKPKYFMSKINAELKMLS